MTMDVRGFGKVAVVLGGSSAEREVSLLSGGAVLASLQSSGVDAHGVDLAQQSLDVLVSENYDRVFIMMHGRGGEDGTLQGALDLLGIPYTGSGVLGSALGMDKSRCKLIWKALGLPTPEFVVINNASDLEAAEALGFPLMIKPVHEGSSIGMAKVDDASALKAAWQAAAEYDASVMAERWITGVEYTAAVLDDQVLPLIRLETPHQFYDYEAKYEVDSTQYICPCGLSQEKENELKMLVLEAFRSVGACGWGRVDLFLDEDGGPSLIEVNTVPGMTNHSLVPMAAKAVGMDFDKLVLHILEGSVING